MTAAQDTARQRNRRIWTLRGLWAQCYSLTDDRQARAQAIVDEELAKLGAEPEGDRKARQRAKWEAELAAAPDEGEFREVDQ
jgi:hypothetical protein